MGIWNDLFGSDDRHTTSNPDTYRPSNDEVDLNSGKVPLDEDGNPGVIDRIFGGEESTDKQESR